MPDSATSPRGPGADHEPPCAIQFHLLGSLPFDEAQLLQRRLAFEASGDPEGRIVVLLCEHAPLITIGRKGSRGHIHWTNEQLRQRQLEVRWVNRGGGCVLHGPGQLSIYPIVPLRWYGWSVGSYLSRLQQSVTATLDELGVRWDVFPPSTGVWGRSGLLAACGIAVRHDVAIHGMFLNVNPSVSSCTFLDAVDPTTVVPGQKSNMGSLLAERRQAISAARLRATLIPHLAASFGTERYHLMTGHPFLTQQPRRATHETRFRAS